MSRLEDFLVLRKLSVGQLKVEGRQVKAVYTVEDLDGQRESTELIYSYDKKRFDPADLHDVNLASMMVAQVALNYGLFAESIELDGVFDPVDRRFLADMLENTSREILTNKLLSPNEFLLPAYRGLTLEKRTRYTQARLVFTDSAHNGRLPDRANRKTDDRKFVILSSGGKDSLLSYGLINELGQAYPVFINEAGRHWFTAVNAYRYFREHELRTAKPWCNSDRVFNWMLRKLPFIRPDFAQVRADIYPVRLWTVAVFLFGALPVALKEGAGNVLIGDEYDTTVRGRTAGISHYSGLYDQSRCFDAALTRYYRDKGWGIRQYSILRSLSELLIMNVLLKRYPHLQAHQVSCHAAHEVDGRMYPCGKCEKCRRIIGMVRALGEDPGACGYTPEQVEQGLRALEERPVKQIGSDAAHLYFLLAEGKLISGTAHTRKMAREHPEIMRLRFDRERSRPDDIPPHLRREIFDILALYANGAVQRRGPHWESVELTDEFLFNPQNN